MLGLVLMVLLTVFAELHGVSFRLYTEASLLLAHSVSQESVKLKTEKMICDMVIKESKILEYVKALKIILNEFKNCQFL